MTEENKERAVEMFKMRLDGATYQEIADKYKVTRQCVEQILKMREPHRVQSTKKYEKIIFKGLKEWMMKNNISIIDIHRKISKGESPNPHCTRLKLTGLRDFSYSEIRIIMEFSGLTFEQLFMQE